MKEIITCGIDIGTTTLSAVVLSITKGEQIDSFTLEHKAGILSEKNFEKIQDADKIYTLVKELIDKIFEKYPQISSVGFTGQMHGILYTNKEGKACSPLYTWQDSRGNETFNGKTYCLDIKEKTDLTPSSGYGLVTHYYNIKNGMVPEDAVSFCSIMDYIAMRLADIKEPLCHPSVAASFGLFDNENNRFNLKAIKELGINEALLPKVITTDSFIGEYKGAKLSLAIGDNQASVFGSVKEEENSVLVNYGTGSQVSVITDISSANVPLEVRPYIGGRYIICGCALCGGYAYEILENFFASYAKALGNNKNQYSVMDELAKRAYYKKNNTLKVAPLFKGTRQDPQIRGSIKGLSTENFDAGNLILATIEGMADELYDMYSASDISEREILVASGNGVRKNNILQYVLEEKFDMKLLLLENKEEAAMGAAMYSALCLGQEVSDIKKCIIYSDICSFE